MLRREFPTAGNPHTIEEREHTYKYICTTCGESWKRNTMSSDCIGIPIYFRWADVPDNLKTKTSLSRDLKKKLAPEQQPAGAIVKYNRNGKETGHYYPLYSVAEAIDKDDPTEAQLKALKKARYMAQSVTIDCDYCGRETETTTRKRARVLSTKPIMCRYCEDKQKASDHAKFLLSKGLNILDTETTGLYGAIALEIAIINQDGVTLFDERIKPGNNIRIDPEAERIHGISLGMLQDKKPFKEHYESLRRIITNKPLVIYNSAYDMPILNRMANKANLREFSPARVDCAMLLYAQFCGQWNDYHNSYRWQPLPGGDHSALGDCRATLDVLKEMAAYQPKMIKHAE